MLFSDDFGSTGEAATVWNSCPQRAPDRETRTSLWSLWREHAETQTLSQQHPVTNTRKNIQQEGVRNWLCSQCKYKTKNNDFMFQPQWELKISLGLYVITSKQYASSGPCTLITICPRSPNFLPLCPNYVRWTLSCVCFCVSFVCFFHIRNIEF